MTTVLRRIKDQIPQRVKRRYYDRRRDSSMKTNASLNGIGAILRSMDGSSVEDVFRDMLPNENLIVDAPIQARAIEINDSCNLDCVMCKTSVADRGKKGLMKIDAFEKAVTTLAKRGMRVTNFHTLGDPIANRNLAEYLEILREHDVAMTNLSTNALMLDRHMDTLFEYRDRIGMLRPSIDGATKETYERIRAGGNWEKLHENLINFAERNAKAPEPFTVIVSSVVAKENWGELAMIPHVFSYLTPPQNFTFGFIATQSPTLDYFKAQSVFGDTYFNRAPCSRNWESLFVLKNGDMTTCCQDYFGELIFGNIFEDDVDEAYNSDFMQKLRKSHLDLNVDEMPGICQQCYVVDPRLDDLLNAIFQYFFREIRKHPIHLQQALNRMQPALQSRDFDSVMAVVGEM